MRLEPIIIVAGDPRSIFFEIFFKTLNKKKYNSSIILICSQKLLYKQLKINKINIELNQIKIADVLKNKFNKRKLNYIDIELKISLRKKLNLFFIKEYIKNSFDVAFKIIKSGITNKVINGPIDKRVFLEKKYLGVTEYIAKKFNIKKFVMLIYNKNLSVSPITTHLPLKFVTEKITKKLIYDKILMLNDFYKKSLKIIPKIAITGLNPHCETIDKFDEDKKIIARAVKNLKKKGIKISGPYASDTIFLKNNRKNFHIVVGLYHDQVLTPIKTIYEFDAINITIGLPFIRVSPDHGPNLRMIGKNESNHLSLKRCIDFLDEIN